MHTKLSESTGHRWREDEYMLWILCRFLAASNSGWRRARHALGVTLRNRLILDGV